MYRGRFYGISPSSLFILQIPILHLSPSITAKLAQQFIRARFFFPDTEKRFGLKCCGKIYPLTRGSEDVIWIGSSVVGAVEHSSSLKECVCLILRSLRSAHEIHVVDPFDL